MTELKAISLFASSGIGDLAVRASGIHVLVSNELIAERAELNAVNFPDTEMLCGDIWELEAEIVTKTKAMLGSKELDFMIATPPCQGMSKNGQGKLLSEIRAGNRPKLDPRNRLIIPTMNIASALKPRVLFFENVPEMANTVIEDENGVLIGIVDYISSRLGSEYSGNAQVVEFADYGVPQRRQRLITIFSRVPKLVKEFEDVGTLIAPATHSMAPTLLTKDWITVRDAIGSFPELDGIEQKNENRSFSKFHKVPVLDRKKYIWISETPPGRSAFDNQCTNPECLHSENQTHGSKRTSTGINRASNETPLFCEICGELLPRPYVEIDGQKRLMKGFTSAYKRMSWDVPSPTLTTNFSYPSSDQNIHPNQNRVLSLYEALTLHTVTDYDYKWQNSLGEEVNDGLIRDSIGESVPPRGLQCLLEHIIKLHG